MKNIGLLWICIASFQRANACSEHEGTGTQNLLGTNSPTLNKTSQYVPQQVIVSLQKGVSEDQKNALFKALKVTDYKILMKPSTYLIHLDSTVSVEEALASLKQSPLVKYAEPNRRIKAIKTSSEKN